MENEIKPVDVTVIGAGIIGISCALQLQKKGYSVRVVDRLPPGEGASYGNAGIFAECGCVPVNLPGFAWQIPKLMLDPLGPLSIPGNYMLKAAPWGLSFVWNSRRSKFEKVADGLSALLKDATRLHLEQAREAGAEQWLSASPYYYLYRDRAHFQGDRVAWEARRKRGIRYDELENEQVQAAEPAVSSEFNFMASLHNHGFARNPEQLVKALAQSFTDKGGEILLRDVRDIELLDSKPRALITHKERLPIDKLVVAAGVWSRQLVAKLDRSVPLQSERGYHIEVSAPGIELNNPIMFAEGKLVATPMTGGIRFAGLVEFGGLEAEPNERFASRLLHHAKKLFPAIDTREYREWMGHRPSLPDSLPVIDRSPNHDSVYYAFGHQHMGLTLGPRTGQLVAELLSTGATAESGIDLSPYRLSRF
ncbi:FAD-binding oxidoreductase [Motiliproteus coralliicola]|uniref:FAD-binding oxidoreductase n=1 Tax=Motiliproteus coralliicola TaxID=2283196 RepID=A0A369WCB5_9GAMM|nr:FAD-binding oxidoreductase [Motiliproteus coralliicola]RDE18953.1 FAD-binding oxidoreductase [Motiliproteus coralliicola]